MFVVFYFIIKFNLPTRTPMKRHPTLQPLSRQHHLGLVIANKAKSVTDDDKLTHHQAFILTIAGATVGFGATWRFPYLVGENGGARMCFYSVSRCWLSASR